MSAVELGDLTEAAEPLARDVQPPTHPGPMRFRGGRRLNTVRGNQPAEETAVNDIEPQAANGKVLWHFTMSLDGFVAGPNHEMDWMMTGISP